MGIDWNRKSLYWTVDVINAAKRQALISSALFIDMVTGSTLEVAVSPDPFSSLLISTMSTGLQPFIRIFSGYMTPFIPAMRCQNLKSIESFLEAGAAANGFSTELTSHSGAAFSYDWS